MYNKGQRMHKNMHFETQKLTKFLQFVLSGLGTYDTPPHIPPLMHLH